MNKHNKFDLFLQQSSLSPVLKKTKLNQVYVYLEAKKWLFDLQVSEVVEPEDLINFIESVKSYFLIPKTIKAIDVVIGYDKIDGFNKFAQSYFDYALLFLAKERPSILALRNFKTDYEDFKYSVEIDADSTHVSHFFPLLKELFLTYGFKVSFETVVSKELQPLSKQIKSKLEEQDEMQVKKDQMIKSTRSRQEQAKKGFSRRSQSVSISEIPVDQYRLDQYRNEKDDTNFLVEGTVSKLEIRNLTNSTLLSFVLGDEDDAIYVKKFLRTKKDFEIAEALKDDQLIQIEGEAKFDTFQRDVVMFARAIHQIQALKKEERLDKAKEKRVEFHVHTKMSNMDGVTSAADYIDQAVKWNHKAIAFTDHNGLYAFPEIHKAAKGKPIKPIYGVELDFVDEGNFQITSKCDQDYVLSQAAYVIFDVETTGLSNTRDKIIEIAGVKVVQGAIIDRFQAFVNPHEPLSEFTKALTNITDEMVEDADSIETVLPRFLKFIEGSILVAHNALFDIGHIEENAKRSNLDFSNTAIIDTLNLARYFYRDILKRFNLKAVAKYFKVSLESHHRAENDAEATANIWLHILADLNQKGIKNYQDINQAIDKNEAAKVIMPYHVNVLVKNQVGYKNLFKIVSKALTDNFYQGARTLKSVVEQHKEGLLIGSGCYKGDVFEMALNRSDEDLKKAIAYYDYIEVQPPQAYRHLRESLGVNADEIVESIILKIVRTAKALNKTVIASGDVHYLNKKDVLYREIYIRTPLVGGGIHDLQKYSEMPVQHFLTTEEMLKEMRFLGDDLAFEIVVKNTNLLNDSIEPIQAFPNALFSLPDDAFRDLLGLDSIAVEVKRLVFEQMGRFYGENPHPLVSQRVQRELSNIIDNQFAPIYYISHLLVKKSLSDGYLVGSRGSVGSSLVATLLEITEVNPLKPHYRCPNGDFTVFELTEEEMLTYGVTKEQRDFQPFFKGIQSGFDLPTHHCPHCKAKLEKDGHDIPFETFLGFDGDKIPDIDLNFSGDYQSKAHDYVRELLGEDHTFRAGTIQTVKERNAFGYVKGYLEDKNLEVRSAQIEQLAKRIEGVKRSTGQHPGGIVVVPKNKTIFDVTPIQFPADDVNSEWKTTHFDYHSFENNLLKLDILGHDDPTMIKFLMDYVEKHPDEFPFAKAQDIPLDDPKVYKLFSDTSIIGVKPEEILSDVASQGIPEFGTPFTRQMLLDTKPKTFAGLVKISGLSHGTDVWLRNAQQLINGHETYGTVSIEEIIGCRDDIMTQLSTQGMSPYKAFEIMEFVRRGNPSKDKVTWLKYEQEMREHKIPEWYIWSASQIKYMFPKAHAAAYVIMAMRIAWFKIYKPELFYSGFFSIRAVQFDYETMIAGSNAVRNKINIINNEKNLKVKEEDLLVTLGVALEMQRRGIKFLPVDINLSEATIFKMEEGGIRMPFNVIDGLGDSVAYDILAQREEKLFTSKNDVKNRTKINKSVFERLETFGAFDDLNDENDVIESGLFAL